VRQLLTESLALALAGGVFGTLLAYGAIRALKAVTPAEGNVPRVQEISIDGYVLGFTILITFLTGVFFGLIPAMQASKLDLSEAIKEGGHGRGGGQRHNRLRSALVTVEIALAIIVLIGGGLMIKGFSRLTNVDPGFNAMDALVMNLALPLPRYPDGDKQRAFYQQLLGRLPSLPGVQSIGIVNPLPISGASNQSSSLPEGLPVSRENVVVSDFLVASPGYFDAMGIRLVRGRDFKEFDHPTAPLVIVVDEWTAERFWPKQDPIGKRMAFELEERGDGPPAPIYRQVIGVVRHIKHNSLLEESRQQVYTSYLQMPIFYRGVLPPMSLVVRAGNPQTIVSSVRRTVASIDRNIPVYNINTMEQRLSDSVARNRLSALLMGSFAGVGMLLAAIGVFGLMSYMVVQRKQEIGVRMALGAQRKDVLRLILGQGMRLVVLGLSVGVAGSLLLTPILSKQLFAVKSTDPATYATVSALLAGVAFLACYLPARRATKVDPTLALRNE
jgi:putative ABC transport system permease protein